jgi:uncharacterized protein YhjY with autotransporter beta-barrel domain
MNPAIMLRLHLLAAAACVAIPAQAQSPAEALDASWVAVCAAATPGSNFFLRCQEILNAGPGAGDRRSDAALGNNLNTVAGQGRVASSATGDSGRVDWGGSGLFFGVTIADLDRTADAFEAGFDGNALSAIVGVDRRFGDRHVLGLAANHQRERADFEAGGGRTVIRQFGLLATYSGGFGTAWSLDGYAGALRGSLDVARRVGYSLLLDAGTPAQRTTRVEALAEGDTDTRRRVAGLALGYLLAADAWSWQFGLGYDVASTRFDAYQETGGAGLALAVPARRVDSRQARLGVRGGRTGSTAFGVLQPYVAVEAIHEFANDQRLLTVAFAGDPSRSPVRFPSAAPDRDWFEAALGLSATLVGGSSAFVEYRQRLAHRLLDERALSFGLRVEFD